MSPRLQSFRPPACKSSLQRALLLAFLAGGRTRLRVEDRVLAEDPRRLIAALRELGVRIRRAGGELVVTSAGWPRGARARLDLGANATALRTLVASAGLLGGDLRFTGDRSLRRRGLFDLVPQLVALGARFDFVAADGCVPLRLRAPGVTGETRLALDLARTSQTATGVLCALAATPRGGVVDLRGPLGYLPLTCAMLRTFGAHVVLRYHGVARRGGVRVWGPLHTPGRLVIPADPSSAAWILALFAGLGRPVVVEGLVRNEHPDLAFLDDLRALGCRVRWRSGGIELRGTPRPGGVRLSLEERPDSFPPLVALLSAVPGRHRLTARRLRGKESDRVTVLARGLRRLGFEVTETAHGLVLRGVVPGSWRATRRAIRVDPEGDHRMAMALALVAHLHGRRVVVRDRACVAKSWPGFWEFLRAVAPRPAVR